MRGIMVMILFAFVMQAQKSPHPAVLTHQIMDVDTIHTLLRMYREHASHLNHVHLSACWTSLGQLAREAAGQSLLQKSSRALEPLVQHTAQAART